MAHGTGKKGNTAAKGFQRSVGEKRGIIIKTTNPGKGWKQKIAGNIVKRKKTRGKTKNTGTG